MSEPTPIMPEKCGTCPFRPGSPYAKLAPDLARSAMTEASRQCHSTGNNALGGRTGKPVRLCRGARDSQLQTLHAMKFLDAPTDEAWTRKCKALGIAQDTQTRRR